MAVSDLTSVPVELVGCSWVVAAHVRRSCYPTPELADIPHCWGTGEPSVAQQWTDLATAWRAALSLAHSRNQAWCGVLEDDAIPYADDSGTDSLLFPEPPAPGIVSLYLGTNYPKHWVGAVADATRRADEKRASWIRSHRLLHGVAVAMPTDIVERMVAPRRSCHSRMPYDETLSYRNPFRTVWYPWPSPVDHADIGSLIEHADKQPRDLPRRAVRHGRPAWTDRYVRI